MISPDKAPIELEKRFKQNKIYNIIQLSKPQTMMGFVKHITLFCITVLCAHNTSGFTQPRIVSERGIKLTRGDLPRNSDFVGVSRSSTSLNERQWNFNEPPRGPFGMKKNAEIWNGRVAQMGFVIVLIQELITGKGVVQGLAEGDFINLAFAGATFAAVLALSAVVVLKGRNKLETPPTLD